MITALCVSPRSIYKKLGLDCYDINRDAFSYSGHNPVIAHSPCRCFSKLRSFVRVPGSDFKLAQFCYQVLKTNGGILEQPAGSKMKDYLGLPAPLYVDQFWFGYPIRKPTWLWFFDCEPLPVPFSLNPDLTNSKQFDSMSSNQRSRTTETFALWLINSIGGNHAQKKNES
jgi:hypothetical protein